MSEIQIFDSENSVQISESRRDFMEFLLKDFLKHGDLITALDVGCGTGFFSRALHRLGLKVTGIDVREQNILEATQRSPEINFHVCNVEQPTFQELGKFDLLLCFGLLYHLENPFLAIRNLYAVTQKILIIETIITPHKQTYAALVDEGIGQDQSLNSVALIPSETAFVKMLYRAGFPHVYLTKRLPDHPEFQESLVRLRRRTVLVASQSQLQNPVLKRVTEKPEQLRQYKRWTYPLRVLRSLQRRFQARIIAPLADSVRKLPFPVRSPGGSLFLTSDDVIGNRLRKDDTYEVGEQKILQDYLNSGMVVIDVGAHHGLYTLLASKKVGEDGRVIAFEPSPRERRKLKWNLLLNFCKNVTIEPMAAGDSHRRSEFYICLDKETGCNSLRLPAVSDRIKTISVPVVELDQYLRQNRIKKVDFIKIDAEGAELEVLTGLQESLKAFKPVVMCEIADSRTEPWGYAASGIYEFLENQGYSLFSITAQGKIIACSRKNKFRENVLAIPKESRAKFSRFMDVDMSAKMSG